MYILSKQRKHLLKSTDNDCINFLSVNELNQLSDFWNTSFLIEHGLFIKRVEEADDIIVTSNQIGINLLNLISRK